MLLQASIKTLKKWFTDVAETIKTVSCEPAYN